MTTDASPLSLFGRQAVAGMVVAVISRSLADATLGTIKDAAMVAAAKKFLEINIRNPLTSYCYLGFEPFDLVIGIGFANLCTSSNSQLKKAVCKGLLIRKIITTTLSG
ncbi:hypothetical protein H6G74_04595 [Nostoc spongiaeforme FACHB-130]|uniref:Uncharacterized protein n=1 Tax=Nostoc spongiaeforme FACHB-130 TaxID=1357510 RepID=A0ABR8FU88_9NOSO|nr:hypothetical protein [Nostoc spongiaeforme]MBD2593609.1 hypothetical protein [Nostoc spongiaeforme FACHB-130]